MPEHDAFSKPRHERRPRFCRWRTLSMSPRFWVAGPTVQINNRRNRDFRRLARLMARLVLPQRNLNRKFGRLPLKYQRISLSKCLVQLVEPSAFALEMCFWIARVPGLLPLPKCDHRIADGQPRLLWAAVFATIVFKPTFPKLGGFELPNARRIKAVDQTDLLLGQQEWERGHFYFPGGGVRQGKWKYLKANAHLYGYAV
jgi:hypothetical protein